MDDEILLSMDDLRNKTIQLSGKVIAVRCGYCRNWVFYDDAECYGCGGALPQFPGPRTKSDSTVELKYGQ